MTETLSSVVSSEIRATGANIKQRGSVDEKLVTEQLKRIRFDCRKHDGIELDERGAAQLVLGDLEENHASEAVISEFKKLYIGG